MAESTTVSVATLSKIFNGLSSRRIQQLEKDGVTKKDGRGKWLLFESITGYVRYLQEASLRGGVTAADMGNETARVKKLTGDKLQIEIDVLTGDLIPRNVVEGTWLNMITAFRAKFLAIPVRAAQVALAASTIQEIEDELRTLIHEALNEFSNEGLPDDIASVAADSLSVEAPAKPDNKPVGRQRKKAKPRVKRGTGTVANKSSGVSKGNTRRSKR